MELRIEGVIYPCKYTVLAEQKLCEYFGSIENISVALNDCDLGKKIDGIAYILEALIAGGVQREKQKSMLLGKEYSGPEPISAEVLAELYTPGEILDLSDGFMAEIQAGYNTTIAVEEPKRKNGKATLSK
nr:MAG TPA: hypothetical protein [Caudoviricetes sp.]